jgi:hypothetical protein
MNELEINCKWTTNELIVNMKWITSQMELSLKLIKIIETKLKIRYKLMTSHGWHSNEWSQWHWHCDRLSDANCNSKKGFHLDMD